MVRGKALLHSAALALLMLASTTVLADPWALSGDVALRHDLRLLADAGIVDAPVNAWPIPWAAIASGLESSRADTNEDPAVSAARARMKSRLNRVRDLQGLQPNVRLAARTDEFWLRTFDATPRDEGEARIGASWMGSRFAARAQVSYAHDPLEHDEEWRGDGSYIAGTFGNHVLSAGALDRWWGPGWNDSLILSSNARPVPALALERSVARPFESRWLSWIGPWRYTLFWGALGNDTVPEDASLLGFRVDFRPLESLEIGLTRTAQWCGEDRPCDAEAFGDLVTGNDNRDSGGITTDNEPGNQLAAADFRWHAPLIHGPWAIYGQAVGEDESSGLPSKYFGQVGLELWNEIGSGVLAGSWRAHVEYTNTLVHFWKDDPEYDTAYEHKIYESGYRFEGRSLGAASDADSDLLSIGLTMVDARAFSWNGLVRFGDVNQRGTGAGEDLRHTVAPQELQIVGAQLSHKRAIGRGALNLGALAVGVGVQYSDNQVTGASDTDAQAFLTWTWDYSGL
jgi:hypothetical protein